ncbi:quaternary amine ABC transporter ATP-binding protein [Paracoccus yeei]|uniref:quaternary amine ABC transporter ATP-binding protein n=1 Tax=Paracoccus yeei TaxID=147645 RepID=UPI00048CF98B|nr:ATP-binding cassette domain-containing protein [Paracoccus yeei]OWJ91000.1 glycine/betaine ABC transporter [Paracoccus yeei]
MGQEIKIRVENVCKIFGPNPAKAREHVRTGMGKAELLQATNHVLGLHDINLDIPAGQVFVIMGLSGSGKSTLIRHFNRLIEPTDGRILIDGQDILQLGTLDLRELRRRRISMVFQKFGLLPHRTVLDNVAYGRIVGGEPAAVARRKAAEFIGVVGLTGFESHLPSQLSGGMQQRVGLARALATDAEILLMDEAFSALDPLIRTEMQVQLKAIQSQLGKSVVFITHDLDEALYLGDTIAILKDGQLRQVGSGNQILMTPADDYVSRFVRDVNRARVLSCGGLARLQCEGWSTQPGQSPRLMAPDGSAAPYDEIDADAPLEAAFATLAAAATPVVVTSNGRAIGLLDRGAVLGALHRPAAQ